MTFELQGKNRPTVTGTSTSRLVLVPGSTGSLLPPAGTTAKEEEKFKKNMEVLLVLLLGGKRY